MSGSAAAIESPREMRAGEEEAICGPILDALKKAEREREIGRVPKPLIGRASARDQALEAALGYSRDAGDLYRRSHLAPAAFAESDECAGALSHGR